MTFDVSFGKLEIYGLHVFPVNDAGNSLMGNFISMSLPKFQQGMQDIALENIAIKASIDNQEFVLSIQIWLRNLQMVVNCLHILSQLKQAQATFSNQQKELFSKYTDCIQEFQTILERLLFQNSFPPESKKDAGSHGRIIT